MPETNRPNTDRVTQRIFSRSIETFGQLEGFSWASGCSGYLTCLEASDWGFYLAQDDDLLPSVGEVIDLIVENPQWLRACKLTTYTEANVYLQLSRFVFGKLKPRINSLLEKYARDEYRRRHDREYDPETGL